MNKDLGREGPVLVHFRGVKYTERRRREVIPVFERPYLKRKFHPATTWREISRSYGKAYEL
jgi:hypothetical protein